VVVLWATGDCEREAVDAVERVGPRAFRVLEQAYYVDALYTATLVRANGWWAGVCDWFDRFVWNGVVQMVRLRCWA